MSHSDTDARPILRHSQQSPIFLTLECPTISLLLKGERKTPTASNETAKTTQKIVLKLQYLSCKYYSQHAIKFMKNGQEYEKRFRSHTRIFYMSANLRKSEIIQFDAKGKPSRLFFKAR
ncbi:hypothetical protein EJB05_47740, partial [Eragrostis curvula]